MVQNFDVANARLLQYQIFTKNVIVPAVLVLVFKLQVRAYGAEVDLSVLQNFVRL